MVVMHLVMLVVMVGGGERGVGTRGEEKGSQNKLLHGATVARRLVDKRAAGAGPDHGRKRGRGRCAGFRSGVDWRHDTTGRFPRTEP